MEELADFEELTDGIKKGINPINVNVVSDSGRAHLAFCVSEKFNAPALIVTETEVGAMEVAEDLRFFSGQLCYVLRSLRTAVLRCGR